MPDPLDYTIGWICAIHTESVAAQAFLDEKYGQSEYMDPNDNNDYTLGKVGKHNVVIAVLPDGEYGISSATSVARDMLKSFPNVRIGLMVGVGGGAPSRKHDIRLGDIVVSAPRNGKGGVFQYDFGKTIQGQEFQETGFLNQPPEVLRAAVNGLRAQYESDGHQLDAAINTVLEKKPRLQKKYKRPDPNSDRLYQSAVTHPSNDESSCVAVCSGDPSDLILRSERTQDEDNPAIHYGLIASANRLVKDALLRDKLAAEKDVLCFEMEAAGLMNHFPCLVVRGICDYSDTHKNKEWQGYAAMAAAAYTKDLLCRIPPSKIQVERRISKLMSDSFCAVPRIEQNVKTIRSKVEKNEDLEILNWLTPIDYGPRHSDFLRRRQQGTGQWLLDTAEYQTWQNTGQQTLFCLGIPGAGKTILTSIVVNELITRFQNYPTIGIAYIYCDFRRKDEQRVDELLASLLKQLAQTQSTLPGSVQDIYDRHKTKRTRPLLDEISTALQSVATIYSRVFIIVDALDECEALDGCRTRFLLEIFGLQAKTGANIFATSRHIPEITEKFEGSMVLEISANDEDVRKYLDSNMIKLPKFVVSSAKLQEEIRVGIIKATKGIFLLTQLHLDSFIGVRSPKAVRDSLKRLPTGNGAYDKAYEVAMKRVKEQLKKQEVLATEVLSWITCTKRPLTTTELRHALAVEVGTSELDEQNLPCLEDMVAVCAGLVTVDKESGIIRLVHYTAQEYLQRTQKLWFPKAETKITIICVNYLSFGVFENGFCQTDNEFEERLRLNKLYDYAARNWGYHARKTPELGQEVMSFLKSAAKVEASSQAMLAVKGYRHYSQAVPRNMTGLHLAAYFGLANTTNALLSNGCGADTTDSTGRTPLSWAAETGHEAIVKLLLATGNVDINSKSNSGKTPLSWATEKGQGAIVKLLLATGNVDVDSKDKYYGRTPLSLAAKEGHEAIVQLLLATGNGNVDVDSKDTKYGRTPLWWAAEKGHEAIVKLLLATENVDVNSMDTKYGRTPLSWAAEKGHEAIVKLLLATEKVDVNLKSNSGRTPLWWAAEKGYKAIVKLLLATGKVNVNLKDTSSWTPLSCAAEKGHEAIVKLLLVTGNVDVDLKSNSGRTPLSLAAGNGHEAIVKLLLATGNADVNSKDIKYGRTPLSWAANYGHEPIVKILLATSVLPART